MPETSSAMEPTPPAPEREGDLRGATRVGIALADGTLSTLQWPGPAQGDGTSPPPLLLWLHATGFNAQTYCSLLAGLADHMRVVAADLRGHGFTTLPAVPGRLPMHPTYLADTIALLERLGRPAIVAGHSLGSLVGIGLAARRPDLVLGLALVEPVLLPPRRLAAFAVLRALGLAGRASPLARMAARRRAVFPSRAAMQAAYAGRGAFRSWPVAVLADYIAGGTRDRPDGQVELACAPAWEAATFNGYPIGIWRLVERIRTPVTLLRGTIASTCAPEAAARFQRLVPQTREHVQAGASHFLPQEAPDLVAAEVSRLAALAGGADR